MAEKTAVINQKGGVGKTTIAFNLGKGLAASGYRTLLVDNDPQGNLTSACLKDPRQLQADVLEIYQNTDEPIIPQKILPDLSLIGANILLSKISDSDFEIIFRLKEGLAKIENDYDFIIIDCLPSFGYLNMAALNASEYILIPTIPAPFALLGLKDLLDTIAKARLRLNPELKLLGILLNLIEGRRTTIAAELETVLREDYGDSVFQTILNKAIKFEESPSFQQSILEYAPESKAAQQFNDFLVEFLKKIGYEV